MSDKRAFEADKIIQESFSVQRLQELTSRIAKLSPVHQEIVEKLVQRLETGLSPSEMTLDQAVDEFERDHPELLRLLAQ